MARRGTGAAEQLIPHRQVLDTALGQRNSGCVCNWRMKATLGNGLGVLPMGT